MRKLGSSPIGCEDFRIRRGITNRVSVYSRVVPYIGYEGFVQPRKGQGEAKLNQYYNHLSVTHVLAFNLTYMLTF